MNHRKFLVNSGFVGAGLLGTGKTAPSLLPAGPRSDSKSHLNMEEKPWHSLCPHCRTRSTR
jgi:hypothetical protein